MRYQRMLRFLFFIIEMTNYRRHYSDHGLYFFTAAIFERTSDLLVKNIAWLNESIQREKINSPFTIKAIVILPDHLHTI